MPPYSPGEVLCNNTCGYVQGVCEDAASSAAGMQHCPLGSDCDDCGPRLIADATTLATFATSPAKATALRARKCAVLEHLYSRFKRLLLRRWSRFGGCNMRVWH